MRIAKTGAAVVAALALAVPVSAADMTEGISISGSMKQDIGFGGYHGGKPTSDDLHFEHDATINFAASGETDGGLGVTAKIDLKGKGGGDIDAAHLNISGAFGDLNFGHNSHASNMHGNKGIGGWYGGGGYYDAGEHWTPAMSGGPPGNDKGVGVRYTAPRVAGIQVGFSFQPESGATVETGTGNDTNVVALGGNLEGEFAGTSLVIGAGMVSMNSGSGPTGDSPPPANATKESWGIGATLGIGDTSLHLRYDIAGAYVGDDTTSFGIGADHTWGALTFGAGVGVKNIPNAGMADTESTLLAVGGTYDLGGGVSLSGAINGGDVDAPGSANDIDDVGVGLRIAFSF